MDSFAKARSLYQGILVLVVSCIGVLGLAAMVESGNAALAVMFGVVTPLGFALGIWLFWRSRASR
jgi:hypothetical protein